MNPASPCLIFNPSARGETAARLQAHLDILRSQCVLLATAAPGDARRLAAQAVRNGFQTIIAAGGDGTAHEVVNGIGDVPGAFRSVRLGILPLGTVNVFARELKLPFHPGRAWKILTAARERTIDLGSAAFGPPHGRRHCYFLQLAGAGLDSRAIELTDWKVKKKIGPFAYLLAGFRALREAPLSLTVQLPASPPLAAAWVLIGNGRYYGGPIPVFPKARLDDGLLDICVIPKVNFIRLAAALAGLCLGRMHRFCAASQFAVPSVTLAAANRVLLELDGENVGELPATLSVQPKALRVIVP